MALRMSGSDHINPTATPPVGSSSLQLRSTLLYEVPRMEYIAIALSLVAVILCIVILTKVNKLLTMLRTPIFKKLTPDMNLKPGARRAVNAQEMAQRGERNNKENRQKENKERPAKENRENRENKTAAQQPARNEQRAERNERGNRRDRREGRPERPRREFNAAPAEAAAPAAAETAAPAAVEAPVAERRPLAPRIPVETPAAPAVEAPAAAPVAAPAVAPVAAPAVNEAEIAPVETTFDPTKVRYGRRNVIKKAPELADDEA